jgi:hypothetical protein
MQEALSLACVNQRLAEENIRLMKARLVQQRAMLVRENALLQMEMYAQQVGQTFDAPLGFAVPACRFAQQQVSHDATPLPIGRLLPRKENRRSKKATNSDSASTTASTLSGASSQSEHSDDAEDSSAQRTTIMMRNIPSDLTRERLLELIDAEGFQGCYNLVYMPIDFSSHAGFGYAFINHINHKVAERFRVHFQGFTFQSTTSDKVCCVTWSGVHQGLEAHVERYRNSPVMHETVSDEFKPAVFQNGLRIPFPPPTRRLQAPRIRARHQNED